MSVIKDMLDKGLEVKENVSIKDKTYMKVGGNVSYFYEVENEKELSYILSYANEHHILIYPIGNASNILFPDTHSDVFVVGMTKLNKIQIKDNILEVGSGVTLAESAKAAMDASLKGLEFSCGIPGSVGGGIYMNAGAYGGELKDVIEKVIYLDRQGKEITLLKEDLDLSYRHSFFSNHFGIIVKIYFKLEKGKKEEIQKKMDELTYLREKMQPLEFPSVGSVFKRPAPWYSGGLITAMGLKGYRLGGMQVSEKHAGFIINTGEGTTNDFIALTNFIKKQMKTAYDIDLELEAKILHFDE